MVTFDSPVLLCAVCGEVVLRDTGWEDCARAHHCQTKECPYKNEFLDQHPKPKQRHVSVRERSHDGHVASVGDSLNAPHQTPEQK